MKQSAGRSAIVAATLGLAVAASEADAEFKGYLKAVGITGESLDIDHAGWSDLLSYQQLARAFGRPGCKFVVEKVLDSASVPLIAQGQLGPLGTLSEVLIELARTGATPHVFFRLELTDVRVDRVSLVGDAEASTGTPLLPTERFFLTAGGATYVYTPISDQGQVGTPVEATVDCAP